jgi:hypothetical protein
MLATTNSGGASSRWPDEFNQFFVGFDVVIIPDNDELGRKHAETVARNLGHVATSIRIVELPGLPPKGDVSDWLDRNSDATQSDFEELVEQGELFRGPNRHDHQCGAGALLKKGSSCVARKVEWIWNGWLPKGKLTILAGAKTAGKSTLGISFMATITSGGLWPDGTRAARGDVLVWSAEDDFEDTILPRFLAAGGDPDRIYHVAGMLDTDGDKRPFDPAEDLPALQASARQLPDLKLIMIDPVVMAIPSGTDSHKNTETRRGLQPLVDLVVELNITGLGITHFTKGTDDKDPIDRVTGSLAFAAVPRVVLAAAADAEGNRRRLVRVASNIGPSGGGFEFSLFQALLVGYDFSAQRVDWGVQLKGAARELLDTTKQSAQAEASEFLANFLANGPIPQRDVKVAAEAHCHSWATVRRAQQKLGIKPKQHGKAWLWELPSTVSTWNPN